MIASMGNLGDSAGAIPPRALNSERITRNHLRPTRSAAIVISTVADALSKRSVFSTAIKPRLTATAEVVPRCSRSGVSHFSAADDGCWYLPSDTNKPPVPVAVFHSHTSNWSGDTMWVGSTISQKFLTKVSRPFISSGFGPAVGR